MRIDENVILGLDIGIGSIGWALIKENPETLEKHIVSRTLSSGEIRYAIGSRIFKVPENAKTKELLNVRRRTARLQRRVIHRRAQRMRKVRRLLSLNGMPESLNIDGLHLRKGFQHDPWKLRKEAIERLLNPEELSIVLIHMAKHRGFKSNSKRDGGEGVDADTGKMLTGLNGLRAKVLASGVTVGAYLSSQPRKRNFKDASGQVVYSNTIQRSLLEEETDIIFAKQQSFGSSIATVSLRDEYKELAFTQRPLASVADMVGECSILTGEKRAPAFAPTAERFRLAQRLTTLRMQNEKGDRFSLTEKQINLILALQGEQAKITYKSVRKLLKFPKEVIFEGVSQDKGESFDVVSRTGSSMTGSHKLHECLGDDGYKRLYARFLTENDGAEGIRCLDYIAKLISENDDLSFILGKLSELVLCEQDFVSLEQSLKSGKFSQFKGTNRLSLKAMEMIIPRMIACGDYVGALMELGLEEQREVDINDVRNPVVQHILREVRKQTSAILRDWNVLPSRVHIELLREVGKSVEERNKIEKGIKDRTNQKLAARKAVAEAFGINEEDVSGMELKRYELWQAQEGKCAYYMLWRNAGGERFYQGQTAEGTIPVEWLRDGVNAVQIDHILPHSRTFDDSFHNLCLCCSSANQAKSGMTPYEWVGRNNPEAWHEYTTWIQSLHIKGLKKRNFLLQNLDVTMQSKFHARNLTDSSYAARLVSRWFDEQYTYWLKDKGDTRTRRVFARPGAITNYLRIQWGIQKLKKDDSGNRIEDDRHHAIDALIVACCTEGQLQCITRLLKQGEVDHSRVQIPLPSSDFMNEAKYARDQIFVSRSEQHTTTGALHEETLRAIRTEICYDGLEKDVLYERKFITSLGSKDLANIKDPHRCPDIVAALKKWLELPKKERNEECNLPRSAHGDIIRHVSIRRGDFTSGVRLKRGSGYAQADNGEIVRTDVYTKKGKFYLVPVYIKQLADGVLPLKAIVANKTESEWLLMDDTYTFCFSLFKDSYVLTQKGDVIKSGYYLSTDRSVASIALANMKSRDKELRMTGIGVQLLTRFEKYIVDRLGRLTKVIQEPDLRKLVGKV